MSRYVRTQVKRGVPVRGALGRVQRGALGAAPDATYIYQEALGLDLTKKYVWNAECKCINTETGLPYPGDQKLSNCVTFHGACKPPSGISAAFDFLKGALLPSGQRAPISTAPDSSFTAGGLLMPAVLVVGGVGLLLVLKKKKK
jgi:hypothetical protein